MKAKFSKSPAAPSGRTGEKNLSKRNDADDLEEWALSHVENESFEDPQIEDRLWDGGAAPAIPDFCLLPQSDAEDSIVPPSRRLTAAEERKLFLQYNYAKYRLASLMSRRRRQSNRRREQVALWLERARVARETIIHANLPLAPAMAKRKLVMGVEFADMVSEAYMAILRCVERFDVARGFKFSTYACRSILACFHRMGSKAQTYRKHMPVNFEPSMESTDSNQRTLDRQRSNALESVRQVLRHNAAELTDVECRILMLRFPGPDRQRLPLWKVGKQVGLSNERVRQLEIRSLDKLRHALERELTVGAGT